MKLITVLILLIAAIVAYVSTAVIDKEVDDDVIIKQGSADIPESVEKKLEIEAAHGNEGAFSYSFDSSSIRQRRVTCEGGVYHTVCAVDCRTQGLEGGSCIDEECHCHD